MRTEICGCTGQHGHFDVPGASDGASAEVERESHVARCVVGARHVKVH